MSSQYEQITKAADFVANRLGRAPVGVVLGTGLSECLDNLDHVQFLEYASVPGMPTTTIAGHRGAILHGRVGSVDVLALCGRIHMYEDRTRAEVAMPVRLLSMLGVHTLVVTSAVGSVTPGIQPGHLMLVEDHINFSGDNVLAGAYDPRLGPRSPDMSRAYDRDLNDILADTGKMLGLDMHRGLLAHFRGPSYETPAEVRMARSLGASVVSMSLVPEVLVARQRGMRVAGVGCATNQVDGERGDPLSATRVLVGSAAYANDMQGLLSGALARMGSYPVEAGS